MAYYVKQRTGLSEELREHVAYIAPEHLEIQTEDPDWYLKRMSSYGTLFLGTHATVAFSDKAIGTNHVLPRIPPGQGEDEG